MMQPHRAIYNTRADLILVHSRIFQLFQSRFSVISGGKPSSRFACRLVVLPRGSCRRKRKNSPPCGREFSGIRLSPRPVYDRPRARADFRRFFSEGFSKWRRARTSRITPSRSSFFFSRRSAFSMVSPLRTFTSVTAGHAPFRFRIGLTDRSAAPKFPVTVAIGPLKVKEIQYFAHPADSLEDGPFSACSTENRTPLAAQRPEFLPCVPCASCG